MTIFCQEFLKILDYILSEIEEQTLEYKRKAHIARLKAIDEDFANRYGTVSKEELLPVIERALNGDRSWEEGKERFIPYETAEEVVKELERKGYSREKVIKVLRRFFVSRLWLRENESIIIESFTPPFFPSISGMRAWRITQKPQPEP